MIRRNRPRKPGKRNHRKLKIIIAIISVSIAVWLFARHANPQVALVNDALQTSSSTALLAYPYHFKVLSVDKKGIATVSTPRSPDMPVYRMIGAIDPNLSGKDPSDPDFIHAEQQIGDMQAQAAQIILKQPGIHGIKWQLDDDWLEEHGITPDQQ